MKKLCVKLFVFNTLLLMVIIGYFLVRILFLQGSVHNASLICPYTKYICLGSSLTGLGYVEDESMFIETFWRYDLSWQFSLIRLKEMERFNQLSNVKTVIFEVAHSSINQNHRNTMLECWWGMLPMVWRYGDDIPLTSIEKLRYCFRNINKSMSGVMRQKNVPKMDLTLVHRTPEWIAKQVELHARGWRTFTDDSEMCMSWRLSSLRAVSGMKEICDRHQIKLLAIRPPMPSCYLDNVPPTLNDCYREMVDAICKLGIPYYDYGRKLGDENFIDATHLSKDGAKKFTQIVYDDILIKE